MSPHTASAGADHRPTIGGENRAISILSPSEEIQPVLRAYLPGGFILQQADGTSVDIPTVIGRNQSLLLLKLLLCHPQRRLTRDLLTDIIWPGQSSTTMEGSLGVAKSLLKTGLKSLYGQSLLPRVTGEISSYQVVGQNILWTDIDACEQFIRQALAIPDAEEALLQWEAGHHTEL